MTHAPFRGRRPIFIGDDVTDESVFAMMPDLGGLAFSVGRRAQGVTDYFDEPRDVRAWLAHLLMAKPGQDGDRVQASVGVFDTDSQRFCVQTVISMIFTVR